MTTVTQQEIEKIRNELGNPPELQTAVDALEDCNWILEDAALLIASEAGEPVEMGDTLLGNLVEHSRKHLCKPEVRERWDNLKDVFDILREFLPPPAPLAVACILKLSDIGLRNLCIPANSA